MRLKTILIQWCFMLLMFCSGLPAAAHDKSHIVSNAPLPGPESKIVDRWRGTWDVSATRRQPQPAGAVTYSETFEWILDGRYLRSETSRKSDGGKSMSMVWYDITTKSYRFVIFDSAGLAFELPPPTWNESKQTMEWNTGLFAPVSYTGYAAFTDRDTIRWKSLLKDWKGTVILDLEGISTRRK